MSPFELPSLAAQAERLAALGLVERGLPGAALDAVRTSDRAAAGTTADQDGTNPLLVVHPAVVPPSRLAPLLSLGEKRGFVVVDMTDVDDFGPIDGIELPEQPLYTVGAPTRGDEMANWSPEEALAEITGVGRTPLTLSEGISWALQLPGVVEKNHCFMTIGSRLRKERGGLDARTPALWISGGTGRDGRENRGAPKVGWCWARNRHTWLGFASTSGRAEIART
ncbi:DUF5701 family protein [Paraoerskovia marina]|uniref:DUF5701 family protein n=1 Tax=Paraoerskovia marina TaxID=545619 RepID=UPI0004923F41|nr:DUF5701 family protein [Paraoerskovia marina]